MNSDNERSTWPLLWDHPVSQPTPSMARQLLGTAHARNDQMLIALGNVRAKSGVRQARRLQRRYLLSFTAKLSAVLDAWSLKKVDNPFSSMAALEIVNTARDLHAWKHSAETATSWLKLKSNGTDSRLIHSLKFRQTALDKLAARAGRATAQLLPTQFNRKGGGSRKFEQWLTEKLPSVDKIMTVDIPSCFDVIARSSVEVSLLLPKQVVEAAMFHVMDHAKLLPGVLMGITPIDTHAVGTSATKRRVPQGSALAQLASDIEIDRVLRSVAAVHESVHVAAYGDNLIFLLDDASWVGSVRDALTSSVTKQFGSDATTALVHRIRCDAPSHFEFCRRIYRWKNDALQKKLPRGYIDEFETRAMIAQQDAFGLKSLKGLNRCEASIMGFAGSHSEVKGTLQVAVRLLTSLNEYRTILAKKTVHEP
jgi:hypothetical protein